MPSCKIKEATRLNPYQRAQRIKDFLADRSYKTATEIHEHLLDHDKLGRRTLEIFLAKLSTPGAEELYGVKLDCHDIKKDKIKKHYGGTQKTYALDSQAESAPPHPDDLRELEEFSLYFSLTRACMQDLLPEEVVDTIEGRMLTTAEREAVDANYQAKIFASGKSYIFDQMPEAIHEHIFESVLVSLRTNSKLEITYNYKLRQVSPQGLWLREREMYLIASDHSDDLDPLKSFKLNRIASSEVVDEAAVQDKDFTIEDYALHHGIWGIFEEGPATIDVKIKIRDRKTYYHIRETELTPSQQISEEDSAGHRVLAAKDVPNTHEFRWWLQSFGTHLEVVQPDFLRAEMRTLAQQLCNMYDD